MGHFENGIRNVPQMSPNENETYRIIELRWNRMRNQLMIIQCC